MRVVRRVLREGEGEEGDGSVEVGVGEVVDKMGRGGRGVEGIFNPVSLNYMKDGVKGQKSSMGPLYRGWLWSRAIPRCSTGVYP